MFYDSGNNTTALCPMRLHGMNVARAFWIP
jgi:hypothetical protein